jgi:hypothetical protein
MADGCIFGAMYAKAAKHGRLLKVKANNFFA